MSEPMIVAEALAKKLGETQALDDLSFEVRAGSVFGLLGPNGSGKTTAIRLLLGLLGPDYGRSTVFGESSLALSKPTRKRIGYLSEKGFPHDDLPITYLLRYVSAFFDRWDWDRTEDLLRRLDVPRGTPLGKMSAGERRKAELLLVLARDPDLLVLDDPVAGLDVTVRREFLWAALDVARSSGKTVLFTSHILTDVERIADTVGIIQKGRMKVLADLDDLKARTKRIVVTLRAGTEPESIRVPGELARWEEGQDLVIVSGSFSEAVLDGLAPIFGRPLMEDMNLEEIFCAVVGRGRPGIAPQDAAP